MTRSECRTCRAVIVWAVTVNGKPIPLDAEPEPGGNVRVTERESAAPLAEVLGPLERTLEVGPLYMPHHATCPSWGGEA